jgi:hypothetical protein
MIVEFGPGGGYNVYTRLLARHIGRHIPGNLHDRPEHAGLGEPEGRAVS